MRSQIFTPSYEAYQKAVKAAVADVIVFSQFKRSTAYSCIVSTIGKGYGKQYLEYIEREYPELLFFLEKFATGDEIGNPFLYEFKGIQMDALTLRYVKTLGDLVKYFGNLEGKHIVEIGCGFGGQCKVIYDYCTPASYTIVDIPEVLQLTQKYLSHFDVPVILRQTDDASQIKYDLCISNYAFSEFERKYQEHYHKNIVKLSSEGYMLLNYLASHRPTISYTKRELYALMNKHKIYKEYPGTAFDNAIYVWYKNE